MRPACRFTKLAATISADMTGAGDPCRGRRLAGRYQIEQRIGAGGMGVVYRARQLDLDRAVAVKFLAPHAVSGSAWAAQFRAEAQALARLQHPNTVRVYEFGFSRDAPFLSPFLVMELLGGRTLARELELSYALPTTRALNIVIQLCNSLEEAHCAGIIHGDVKPPNVFLLDVEGTEDFVKLVDFSVTRLAWSETSDDRFMETPAFMSPEWAAGGVVGPAADVYSCGVLAFRMLTGRMPSMNRAWTIHTLLAQTTDDVAAVVLRAMDREPQVRYPGVAELRSACQESLAGTSSPPSRAHRVASSRPAEPSHTWNAPPPGLRVQLSARIANARMLTWSPDGRWLAICEPTGLHLYDFKTNQWSVVQDDNVRVMTWLGEGDHVVLAGGTGAIVARIGMDRAGNADVLNAYSIASMPVHQVACARDGSVLAIASLTRLHIFDAQSWVIRNILEFGREITSLAWSSRGRLLAVGTTGRAEVFDEHGRTVLTLVLATRASSDGRFAKLQSHVSWAHDANVLAVGGAAYGTEIWDTKDGKQVATLETSALAGVSFSAAGPLFANLDTSGALTVWRYDRIELVATLEKNPSAAPYQDDTVEVHKSGKIAFHPKLPVLAAVNDEGVFVWNLDVDTLLGASAGQAVHYANAKVVIVGDSGVGKSALGLVLTGEEFRPTESTHGRQGAPRDVVMGPGRTTGISRFSSPAPRRSRGRFGAVRCA